MGDKNKQWPLYSTKCCNPFSEEHTSGIKCLRNVSTWMCSLESFEIKSGMKICSKCRTKLYQFKPKETSFEELYEMAGPSNEEDPEFIDKDSSLEMLNRSLSYIGESPVSKKKCTNSKDYAKCKLKKVKTSLETKLFSVQQPEQVQESNDEKEMLQQLQEKFKETTSRSEKITILTVLPKSWSRVRIINEFKGATDYMARQAKKLVSLKGVLSSPDPKPGRPLDIETTLLVKEFYNDDEVSRIMPGKSDVVSVREGTSKILVQKRLILSNLNEIYQQFKVKYHGKKIGFSKFCELRPSNCIVAGANGTHSVCVCLIHQNVKLMMNGAHFEKIELQPGYLKTYNMCLSKIICNPARIECYMNDCSECPGVSKLRDTLVTHFEESFVEDITYKQWLTVDRCMMQTIVKNVQEFVDDFCNLLLKLNTHDFIAKMQKSFYNELKESLTDTKALVTCDFAENYSFVLQDEVQSYHWTSVQATIFPCVIYFKSDCKIQHMNVVFISECLKHDTVAVYTFMKKLILMLKSKFTNLGKVFYFSDGSAAQFKNCKNFLNLCNHHKDFQLEAEWHFFASAHGKSACDGLGGTIKRMARKASLQRPYNDQILTPRELFLYAKENILGINFEYTTIKEYKESEDQLSSRFQDAKQLEGTQKFHSYIPKSDSEVAVKRFSSDIRMEKPEIRIVSESAFLHRTCKAPKVNSGYITAEYDDSWWVACILASNEDITELRVTFLHPKGPSPSFFYPVIPDIQTIPAGTILMQVEPTTPTGRVYTLSKAESQSSSHLLAQRLQIRTG